MTVPNERLEALMVKVVDDVATPREREELMRYLMDHPVLRLELDEHLALKATTDQMVERLELDLAEDRHRNTKLSRAESTLGTGLVLGGAGVLAGVAASQLLLDPTVPFWVRAGAGLLTAGTTVLLGAAVHWRLHVRKHDRYTEVIR